jgi:cobalt/nickel transport system ATP-binding protein
MRISLRGVSYKYPDGTVALSGIDIEVKKGEFIGVLGENGCGKTTLLKAMDGLLKEAEGNLNLDGADIRKLTPKEIYRKIGLVFQNPDDQLFAPTLFEDVAFGPLNMGLDSKEVQTRVLNALQEAGLSGLEKKSIHNLSFGQKKRACIAGLLSMGHEILLLDEPTAGLDPMGEHDMMNLLMKLNKDNGVTMVMATHSIDLVPLFIDRILILNKGKIIAQGNPQKIFSEPEMIRLAGLRLPRIGHLFEILKKKDGFDVQDLPLTIGQARKEIKRYKDLMLR